MDIDVDIDIVGFINMMKLLLIVYKRYSNTVIIQFVDVS